VTEDQLVGIYADKRVATFPITRMKSTARDRSRGPAVQDPAIASGGDPLARLDDDRPERGRSKSSSRRNQAT
jgi:hypothetical protein